MSDTVCSYGGDLCGAPAVGLVPCFSEYGTLTELRAACQAHYGYWGTHVGYDYRRPIRPETGCDGLTVIECRHCGLEFYEYSIVLFQGGQLGYRITDHECRQKEVSP